MSQKQLWQVGWAEGQTDGDCGEQIVRKLTNVEIDVPGQLRPRDKLVQDTTLGTITALDVKYMPIDPTGNEDGTQVILTSTAVTMKNASVNTSLTIPGGSVDADSQLVVSGDRVYLVAKRSGEPDGIYIIWYMKAGTQFPVPTGYDRFYSWDYDGSNAVTGDWTIMSLSGVTPNLRHGSSVNLSAANPGEHDIFILAGATALSSIGAESSFALPYMVEYRAQFVFDHGGRGPISKPIFMSEDSAGLHIAYKLFASENLSEYIRAINIYRKVVTNNGSPVDDSEFDLIMTATVKKEDTTSEDSESNPSVLQTEASLSAGDSPIYQVNGANTATTLFRTPLGHASGGDLLYSTNGWGKYSTTDNLVYMPDHTVFTGKLSLRLGLIEHIYDDVVAVFPAEFPEDKSSQGYGDGWIIGNFATCQTSISYLLNNYTISNLNFPAQFGVAIQYSGGTAGINGGTPSSVSLSALTDYIYHPHLDDYYGPSLHTLTSINGVSVDEISDTKPEIVSVAGGYMLQLNLLQDGESKPSRLAYSSFRNFSLTPKSNYIDYGLKDDGEGVAIATFRNRAIILFTNSAYILDMSGGSDMAWRELGAFRDVGCESLDTVIETPVGVFFADRNGVYWWDGGAQVQKITEFGNRYLKNTYLSYYASGITALLWRSDMRQLWVCDDLSAMVFDVDRGAWHEHDIEADITDGALLGAYNETGDEYLAVRRTSGNIEFYAFTGGGVNRPFQWGIDTGPITMGSSEFIKKFKRVYIDTEGAASGDLVLNPSTNNIQFTPGAARTVHRISASVRAYAPSLELLTVESVGKHWNGVIESLGISYKPKKLK